MRCAHNGYRAGFHELASYLPHILDGSDQLNGILVMGDFNEDAQEMRARGANSRQGQLIAADFVWSGAEEVTEKRTGRQIDWIFYREVDASAQVQLKSTTMTQEYSASDHVLTAASVMKTETLETSA